MLLRSARVGEWQKGHQGSRSASEKPTSKVTNARVSQHQTSVPVSTPRESAWANQHGQSEWSNMEIVTALPIPDPPPPQSTVEQEPYLCTTYYNVLVQ